MIILKNNIEIKKMQRGGKLLKKILEKLIAKVKPGISTKLLESIATKLINQAGGKPSFRGYRDYPAAICVSINDQIVHGIPSKRIIKSGDIVSLDVGLKYQGFHTDVATTVAIGRIKPIYQKLIQVTQKALKKAILKAKPNNHLSDISAVIQKTIEGAGFGVVRECAGHGIGRNLHEDLAVLNYGLPGQGPIMKPGMTFAIEPMATEFKPELKIEKDGWTISTADKGYSAHFEHSVAITPKGCLVLTH